ncbi:MAG: RtcB family protein [Anaerolineales bacterium]|nr:RtcB family protein [Anaerolineales bacterium]
MPTKIQNTVVYGDPIDQAALKQIHTAAQHERVVHTVLMADHHKGYGVPIGGVVAYREAISPTGVGYDIGCGNMAVKLDLRNTMTREERIQIGRQIQSLISFGVGEKNLQRVWDDRLEGDWWQMPHLKGLRRTAEEQLGTVGGGNHYVDIFEDEDGYVWIGVHFGSRGLGHQIATHFLKEGGAAKGMDAEPLVFEEGHPLFNPYLESMKLAGVYATVGREWACHAIAEQVFAAEILDRVHNHHNYAWLEEHPRFGGEIYVVRKGATPAFDGQRGFIGASMGDDSYIVAGVANDEAAEALYSTVHGAGRVMSRTAARGKYDRRTGRQLQRGQISERAMADWLKERDVLLFGGDLDEAPQAYKRLDEVLVHHQNTIVIKHVLKPLIVLMAGKDVFDPYKD